jgi:hypothetical protein
MYVLAPCRHREGQGVYEHQNDRGFMNYKAKSIP